MSYLAALFLVSLFLLNLTLQTGLGVLKIRKRRNYSVKNLFFEYFVLFLSVLIQYLFFTFVFSPLNMGVLKYFMIFPFAAAFSCLCRFFYNNVVSGYIKLEDYVFDFSYNNGICVAAVALLLCLASSVKEAVVLDLGFCAGVFCAVTVVKMIMLRMIQESASDFFRGIPLMLISMGLLSIIWVQAALVYLNQRGGF